MLNARHAGVGYLLQWRSSARLLFLSLLLLTSCAAGGSGIHKPKLATTPRAPSLTMTLPAQARLAPVIGPLADTTPLHVGLTFTLNQQEPRGGQGQDRALSRSAQPLQTGISTTTYQQIQAFFGPKSWLSLNKLHTYLTVDAQAGTFAMILKIHFVVHRLQGRNFYAPDSEPVFPPFLKDQLVAVTGLDNYSTVPHPGPSSLTFGSQTAQYSRQASASCQANAGSLFPRTVAHAYGLDQLWATGLTGTNMTVNLVEADADSPSDVQTYLSCIGFQGKFSSAVVDQAPQQSLGEATLDIEMIAGLARGINIISWETNGSTRGDIWTQINDILQQILNTLPSGNGANNIVSISLGAAEDMMSPNDRTMINQSLQQLQLAHVAIFIASGDQGAYAQRPPGAPAVAPTNAPQEVSFPASSPWAIAVGGTILSTDATGNRSDEVAWSGDDRHLGTGGGNSHVFPRAQWQQAPGVISSSSTGMRQIPDVAAAATNLAMYYKGQWGVAGGTSAAAPIWAAGLGLVNEGLLQQHRATLYAPGQFYALSANELQGGASPFFDVTQGSNQTFSAQAGWDYTTGLGAPTFSQLYQTGLSGIPVPST
jgi:kumamolisin